MTYLPIFDSNAHPTLSGKWVNGREGITASFLIAQMESSDVRRACAVGMYGVDGYEDEAFIKMCHQSERLVPIAGINPDVISDPEEKIEKILQLGFRGVKIHPRLCNISLDSPQLKNLLSVCTVKKLPVFLCTYYWEKGDSLRKNNYDALVELISVYDELPLVLLHGGVHDILKLSEVVRYYPNTLLDLSFTILKYEGSSLDLDIEYLFHQFDRRLCIGSDQPEFVYPDLRRRFEYFSRDISEEKARNIAYRNITNFLGESENVFQK